jgi:hypothetical protein
LRCLHRPGFFVTDRPTRRSTLPLSPYPIELFTGQRSVGPTAHGSRDLDACLIDMIKESITNPKTHRTSGRINELGSLRSFVQRKAAFDVLHVLHSSERHITISLPVRTDRSWLACVSLVTTNRDAEGASGDSGLARRHGVSCLTGRRTGCFEGAVKCPSRHDENFLRCVRTLIASARQLPTCGEVHFNETMSCHEHRVDRRVLCGRRWCR